MNLIDKILGKKEKGMPCYVVAHEANRTCMVQGSILEQVDKLIRLNYLWIDNTNHSAIAKQFDYLFEYNDIPVYCHNVGSQFVHNFTFEEKTEENGDISSLYLNKVLGADIGGKMISSLEQYFEGGGMPWKQIIIIGGIIIVAILLWQSGIIPDLLNSVKGSINPGYTAP